MNASGFKVMIMAGGTGGHVFPALAVAHALTDRGADISWLGTRRGIEAELVPTAQIPLHFIRVEGVRGKGLLGLLKAPFLLSSSLVQAVKIIRSIRPDVVIGFGGFVSGPGGLAARLLRKPLVIHEQNAIAGTTNRLLARIATRILTAFPGALTSAYVVGNPVRTAISALLTPAERYAARGDQPLRLLILGGSLGARAINECVPEALALLPSDTRPEVWHQTGKQHLDATRELYQRQEVSAKIEDFITDMAAAYAWADVVVCRAGALTVSELMAAGVAAVLVPLPHAIDDHQTANARVLAEGNAALLVPQTKMTPAYLAALLQGELAERKNLALMAGHARKLALPSAADAVADICAEVVRG